ncbi:MAG TPA: response regulator transcription factor [Acidimicrobiia bacterium]
MRSPAVMKRPDTRQRVLVVEDEPALVESIAFALELEGFDVVTAGSGRAGIALARETSPSLVLLDIMLPESSGLDVCRQIRAESDVPIIMLTARDSEADKVAGLELGADDYVTKPFSMRELVARVRAQIRRSMRSGAFSGTSEVLRGGRIELDLDAHLARVDGTEVELRPKEFDLLESLMRRKNRLATRETLIDEVWGPGYFGDTKTLDVHIKRLRQKLELEASRPAHIVTVRGLGYKFVDD